LPPILLLPQMCLTVRNCLTMAHPIEARN
jgi:hypothetical protein